MAEKTKRNTKQRAEIVRIFEHSDRPLSAEQVLAFVQKKLPQTGIATVYRALKDLTAQAVVVAVDVHESSPRYELSGKGHHHHFHCKSCNEVYDLPGCLGKIDNLLPSGFTADQHEIVLMGTCSDCNVERASKKSNKSRPTAHK